MTKEVFNDSANNNQSILFEAMNKLWEVIATATNLESTTQFSSASEDNRQNLVNAIRNSQDVFYKCQILQTAQLGCGDNEFDMQELEDSGNNLNAAIASLA